MEVKIFSFLVLFFFLRFLVLRLLRLIFFSHQYFKNTDTLLDNL